jgi:hypothetical protein
MIVRLACYFIRILLDDPFPLDIQGHSVPRAATTVDTEQRQREIEIAVVKIHVVEAAQGERSGRSAGRDARRCGAVGRRRIRLLRADGAAE